MRLFSDSVNDRHRISEKYAFATLDSEQRTRLSQNLSPHMAWDGLPQETKSLVLICHDPDVPSSLDDVNQEGREVSADVPRTEFFHWVLVDILPALSELREAEFSQGIVPRGKAGP